MGESTHFAVIVDAELDDETKTRIDERLRSVIAEELAGMELLDIPIEGENGGAEFAPGWPGLRPPLMGVIVRPFPGVERR